MEFIKQQNEFLNETLYKGVHKSGLTVMVLEKKDYEKYYAIISTNYGSNHSQFKAVDEKEFTVVPDGIAHFLEHKLFEQPDGTNAFDKFSLYGAEANAFTSFDNTGYLFSTTSNFYESLEHLLSYVFTPYFTDENVSKEQGIIGQEIRMYDDDPDWRVLFNMLSLMFQNHPIKKDIAGTIESISKIDKDLLYKCYNLFYHPENMILFLTGNVDLDKISEIIDEKIQVREDKFEVINQKFIEENRVNDHFISQKLTVSTPIFSCGYKDMDLGETGKPLAKKNLLTAIIMRLFVSKSSPLYERLYDNGLINDSFYSDITMHKDYSFIQFGGEAKDPQKVCEEIKKEAKRIKKEGFVKEDFDRVKKLLYGKYVKGFNYAESIANSFCANYFLGITLFDFLDVYEGITFEEMKKRFDSLFNEDLFVLSVIEPNE